MYGIVDGCIPKIRYFYFIHYFAIKHIVPLNEHDASHVYRERVAGGVSQKMRFHPFFYSFIPLFGTFPLVNWCVYYLACTFASNCMFH